MFDLQKPAVPFHRRPAVRGANKARRIAAILNRVLEVTLVIALSVMVLSICAQVVGRYVFNDAPGWSEEVATFLMAWITMLASAALLGRNGHIAVTILIERLPTPVARGLYWLRDSLIIAMSGFLVYYGVQLAVIGDRRQSPALEISMAYPYMAIPLGAGLIAFLTLLYRIDANTTAEGDE